MNERKYEVGDEVWLPAKVVRPDRPLTKALVTANTDSEQHEIYVSALDFRTADDFKGPQDQAIVDAVMMLPEEALTDLHNVRRARQAKLDATRPKTAEEVIAAWLPDKELSDTRITALAQALRSAGLLREDKS